MVLVPPELRRIEKIALRQPVLRGDARLLLLVGQGLLPDRRVVGKDANTVFADLIAVELEHVRFARFGIDQHERREPAGVDVEEFAPIVFAERADLGKLRLQPMIEIEDRHDEGHARQEGIGIRPELQNQIDARLAVRGCAIPIEGDRFGIKLRPRLRRHEIELGRFLAENRIAQRPDGKAAIIQSALARPARRNRFRVRQGRRTPRSNLKQPQPARRGRPFRNGRGRPWCAPGNEEHRSAYRISAPIRRPYT